MLKGRLQLFQESIFFDLEEKHLTERSGIKEWRQLYKTAGKDPNRYRHSAEAYSEGSASKIILQPINSAIELNNFFLPAISSSDRPL